MKALNERGSLSVWFSVAVAISFAGNIMTMLGILPVFMGVGCLIVGIVASACIPLAVLDEKLEKMTKGDKGLSSSRRQRLLRLYKIIEK